MNDHLVDPRIPDEIRRLCARPPSELSIDEARAIGARMPLLDDEGRAAHSIRDILNGLLQDWGIAVPLAEALWAAHPTAAERRRIITLWGDLLADGPWSHAPTVATEIMAAFAAAPDAETRLAEGWRKAYREPWRHLLTAEPTVWFRGTAAILDGYLAGNWRAVARLVEAFVAAGRPVTTAGIEPFLMHPNAEVRAWAAVTLVPLATASPDAGPAEPAPRRHVSRSH